VLYTSPAANSEIKAGDTVTIFVSRARVEGSVNVPDFCGMELSAACRSALLVGLLVEGVESSTLNDVVTKQSIPAGTMVRRGSYISFITKGSDETKEREWPPVVEETDNRERTENDGKNS